MIAAAKLASRTVDPAVGSAVVRSRVLITPASADTIDEEHDARAEERREQTHHLLVDEDLSEETDRAIEQPIAAVVGDVEVRRVGQTEAHDVHEEYPEHREAAEGIDGDDATVAVSGV